MSFFVFCAVLLAALMHAGWNALVKIGTDRLSSLLILVLSQIVLSIVLIPFFPLPTAASIPWLLASAIVHVVYKLTLIRAYDVGDFSQVYPLARGSAPLIVAVVSIMVLGDAFTASRLAAILLIGGGVCVMSFGGGRILAMQPKALVLALTTGGFIASYTLLDGLGARAAGTASGFYLMLNIVDGILTCAYVLATHGPVVFTKLAPHWRAGLAIGAMAMAGYWIAIWGYTQAPIAMVSALRETSVLFAIIIAVVFMKERVGASRIFAACLILSGVVLMRV